MYDSLGLWESMIKDPALLSAANRGAERVEGLGDPGSRSHDRLVPTASIPLLDVDLAIAELQHAAGIGLHVVSLPTGVPEGLPDWNRDHWEPLWAAAEEAGHGARLPHRLRRRRQGNACSAARAARSSTTWRPPTAASASAMKLVTRRRARPPPDLQGAHLRGRRDVGAVHRRPHERGLPPARHVRAADAVAAAQGDPLPAGVRVVPARRVGAGRAVGDGLPQRDVGQRLPAPRGHVRAHAEDAARALRRRRSRRCATASGWARSRSSSPTSATRPANKARAAHVALRALGAGVRPRCREATRSHVHTASTCGTSAAGLRELSITKSA